MENPSNVIDLGTVFTPPVMPPVMPPSVLELDKSTIPATMPKSWTPLLVKGGIIAGVAVAGYFLYRWVKGGVAADVAQAQAQAQAQSQSKGKGKGKGKGKPKLTAKAKAALSAMARGATVKPNP